MNYCPDCGNLVELKIPHGDSKFRFVCKSCKAIHYENPKMVVGSIPEYQGKILLCRRAIDPSLGKWTLPAGYLENGETIADGARRETDEEAGATLTELTPYIFVNISFINQIYFIYRAQLANTNYHPGSESLEVKLFNPKEIPWTEIAFDSIRAVLKTYCTDLKKGTFPFRVLDIEREEHQSPYNYESRNNLGEK